MIKPWHLLPVLAASALAASAYWWQAEKDRWTPPAPLKPDLPQVDPLPQHERVRALRALERPVFWTSRRPVEVDDKKNSQAREIAQSRLTAVFESGSERVAILQRTDGSTLKVTADSKPWRIESFDGRKATFVSADGGRVVRPLEAGNPPAAKTPPPGPVADRVRKPAASQ